MKHILYLLFFPCLFHVNTLRAQNQAIGNPPNWNWVQTIGGLSGADHGQSIVGDAQGNFFIAGDFSGSTQFDNNTLTAQGLVNGFVAKCDPTGSVLWTNQFKSSSIDGKAYAMSVALDPNGNVLVLGHFRGGNLKLGNQVYTLLSGTDLFLAKFGPDGTLIWMKTESTFYNTGIANGKVLADDNGDIFVLTNDYLRKFNSNGNPIWSTLNESQSNFDLVLKGNQLLYAGTFSTQIQLGNETLNAPKTAIFVTNVDKTNGDFFNAAVLASNIGSYALQLNSISMRNETDFFLAGSFKGSLSVGAFSLESQDASQYFVAKFVAGNCSWAVQSQGNGGSYFGSNQARVLANDAGDVYLLGNKSAAITFGNSNSGDAESGFLAKFEGSTGNTLFLEAQPAFSNGWTGGQDLVQIGAPFFNLLVRKTNDAGAILFDQTFDGDSGLGYVTSVKTDHTGLYFSANVSGKTYFLGQENYNSKASIVITKTNHAGNTVLWQKTIAGATGVYTYGHSLWLDKNNEKLYLIGTFPEVFNYGTQLVDTSGGKGVFVSQMNTDGTFGWIKTLPKNAYINSVITDAEGNVFINGTFTDELHLDNISLVSAGSSDIFWAKMSAGGQFLLAQRMGGEDEDFESYAGIDGQGNFYMSGLYYSVDIDFNGTNQTTHLDGDGIIYHLKFAPNGEIQWIKNLGNSDDFSLAYDCSATSVEVDSVGNSFIIGFHGESNYFGDQLLTSPYSFNTFVTKISPTGSVIWAKSIQTKRIAYTYCEIGLDEAGDCYIGGQYRDSIYFDGALITKVGSNDAYFAKMDGTTGTTIWAKTISGSSESVAFPSTIAVHDHNSIFVGGHIDDRLRFDAQTMNTNGGRKGFLALIGESIQVSTSQPSDNEFYLTVAPNPTGGKITLSTEINPVDPLGIEIYSTSGQLVAQKTLANFSGNTVFDLSEQPAGIYFLKANTTKGAQLIRVVKNK